MTHETQPTAPGSNKKKPILVSVAVVAAIALVIAGVFVYRAVADGNIKDAYNKAVAELVTESNVLSQTTAALVAIAPENEAVQTASAKSTELLEEAISTGTVIPTETELNTTVLVEAMTVIGQSGDSQSGETSSVTTMLEELQGIPTGEEESQSDDAAQSDTMTAMVFTLDANPEATASAEQTTTIEHLTAKIADENAVVAALVAETVTSSYDELITTEQTAYDAARETFDTKITAATKLVADSKDKVTDNKTRETLTTAIEKAQESNPLLEGAVTPSELREATVSLIEATKNLEAPSKAVSDSVAAKKVADDKAAAERVAAEQATANNSGYTDNSYYGENNGNSGYNSGSGDGGYTGDSGGSGSGGGGSAPAPTPNPAPSTPSGGGGDDGWTSIGCFDGAGKEVPCNW